MRHYVVTGGLGFIGSHLSELLLDAGHRVTIIDDRRTSVVDRIQGATIIEDDVVWADWPSDIDGIFHLAGPVGPVGVIEWSGKIVSQVVQAAERTATEARMNDCPLVYVSTSEVYGEQRQPVNEWAPRIISAGATARMEYAVAKLATETMLLNDMFLDVRIIRPFNVAGPRQSERGGFVLPRFLRQAKSGQAMTVYRPGTQRRAFTHVIEIASGIYEAMRRGRTKAVYNLGNPANEMTILDLALRVRNALDSASAIEIIDPVSLHGTSFAEAPDKIPDIGLAQADLGFYPVMGVDAVIADLIAHEAGR